MDPSVAVVWLSAVLHPTSDVSAVLTAGVDVAVVCTWTADVQTGSVPPTPDVETL